jgi:hypothetical protein
MRKPNAATRRADPATIRRAEHDAYHRAADLAKSYAEHWEREARRKTHPRRPLLQDWTAEIKAGHWRIIEKEIRALARQPKPDDA